MNYGSCCLHDRGAHGLGQITAASALLVQLSCSFSFYCKSSFYTASPASTFRAATISSFSARATATESLPSFGLSCFREACVGGAFVYQLMLEYRLARSAKLGGGLVLGHILRFVRCVSGSLFCQGPKNVGQMCKTWRLQYCPANVSFR